MGSSSRPQQEGCPICGPCFSGATLVIAPKCRSPGMAWFKDWDLGGRKQGSPWQWQIALHRHSSWSRNTLHLWLLSGSTGLSNSFSPALTLSCVQTSYLFPPLTHCQALPIPNSDPMPLHDTHSNKPSSASLSVKLRPHENWNFIAKSITLFSIPNDNSLKESSQSPSLGPSLCLSLSPRKSAVW